MKKIFEKYPRSASAVLIVIFATFIGVLFSGNDKLISMVLPLVAGLFLLWVFWRVLMDGRPKVDDAQYHLAELVKVATSTEWQRDEIQNALDLAGIRATAKIGVAGSHAGGRILHQIYFEGKEYERAEQFVSRLENMSPHEIQKQLYGE